VCNSKDLREKHAGNAMRNPLVNNRLKTKTGLSPVALIFLKVPPLLNIFKVK
jgi:hypothetical protein